MIGPESLRGDDPFDIARAWLEEARASEPNDPNAIALASVDADGLRMCGWSCSRISTGRWLDGSFVFYTNYDSAKGRQIEARARRPS